MMGIQVEKYEIDSCYRLGKLKGKLRPVLVKFVTQWRKDEVYRKRYLLKGHKLYIDHDLSKEELTIVRQLKPRMNQQRTEGNHAVVKGCELIVNGQKQIEDHRKSMNVSQQRKEIATTTENQISPQTKQNQVEENCVLKESKKEEVINVYTQSKKKKNEKNRPKHKYKKNK
uniref:Uncharacterized protein n=1 Tax=Cacopsylla melanoneura TaxID=428564 RepID=A0A8D8RM79_9HEMI